MHLAVARGRTQLPLTLDPTPNPTPIPKQDNQLVKKFSEAKRTAEAERESQAP